MNQVNQLLNVTNFKKTAVFSAVCLLFSSQVLANPAGLSVESGQVGVRAIDNLLEVTNSPGAVLNWQKFNINTNETTRFIQETAHSHVVNRVLGGHASEILGRLESNGQVFLINPAGIVFGQNAQINTAGLLASTLSISQEDLENRRWNFSQLGSTAGGIVNKGKINTADGGSVILIAPNIENSGIIHAEGEALLAAGYEVTLVDPRHPSIGLSVKASETAQAINLGDILADNISVFASLIQNTGVVQATGAKEGEGGVIHFRAEKQVKLAQSAQLIADGTTGGDVQVTASQGDVLFNGLISAQGTTDQGGELVLTGKRVSVASGSEVNADGQTGGGNVAIGGGWQGADPDIQNSTQTIVQADAKISANAIEQGGGGEVVVWSDGITSVSSTIEAKGGTSSGDGGRVETSGKKALIDVTPADTSAPNGKKGTWLIDPPNIVVLANANIPNGEQFSSLFTGQNGQLFLSDEQNNVDNTYIATEAIVSGLVNNGTVRLNALDQIEGGNSTAPGNIRIDDPILISNQLLQGSPLNSTLTLEAQGSVFINAPIGYSNDLFVTDNDFDLFILSQRGDILFNAPVGLNASSQQASFGLGLTFDVKRAVHFNSDLDLGVTTTGPEPENPSFTISPFNDPTVAATNQLISGVVFNPDFKSANPIDTIDLTDPELFPIASNGFDFVVNGTTLNLADFDDDSLREDEAPLGFSRQNAPIPVRVRIQSALDGSAQGVLNTSRLYVNTLNVASGGLLRADNSFNVSRPFLYGQAVNVDSNGQVQALNTEFAATNMTTQAGSLVEIGSHSSQTPATSSGYFGNLTVAGTLNVSGSGSRFEAEDMNLTGILNLSPGQSTSSFVASTRRLIMGSTGVVNLFPGALYRLGAASLSQFYDLPESELTGLSSTGGIFIGSQNPSNPVQRSAINLIGTGTATTTVQSSLRESISGQFFDGQDSFFLLAASPTGLGLGAMLDITGLDANLNTPVNINVTGQESQIYSSALQTVQNMTIGSNVAIHVSGAAPGSLGPNLLGSLYIASNNANISDNKDGYQGLYDLQFNGQLTANGGRVTLAGNNLDVDNAVGINLNSAELSLVGQYQNTDLAKPIRNNSPLLLSGILDNSFNVNPLTQGKLIVFDDLELNGGVLQSNSASIDVAPDSLLQLHNVNVSAPINLNPQGYLYAGFNTTLNNTLILMAGDAGVIFETDASGNRVVNDSVTFKSSAQGNSILAGFKSVVSQGENIPTNMSLTLGSQTRFEINGQAQATESARALELFYGTNIPTRSPFRVGTLTGDFVAVAEYDKKLDSTEILSDFSDGIPYILGGEDSGQSPGNMNCAFDFCIGIDPIQAVTLNSQVFSVLSSDSISAAGIEIANLVASAARFARRETNTNGETTVTLGEGTFDFSPGVFNGVSQVVVDGTIRFGGNVGLTDLPPNFVVNGQLIVDAGATLGSGFTLAPGGQLINNGNLTFNGIAANALQGTVSNNGLLNLAPGQVLNFSGNLNGSGSLLNQGQLAFSPGISIQNTLNNVAGGGLNFAAGAYALSNNLSNGGLVNLNGTLNFASGASFQQTGGTLLMRPGSVIQGNVNLTGGIGQIIGQIGGNLSVGGASFQPGNSPGLTNITGNLNLAPNSVTVIEIQGNGNTQGVDFDFIQVGGTANLAGTLSVVDISALGAPGRNPAVNPDGNRLTVPQTFRFLQASAISGQFASFQASPRDVLFTFNQPVLSSLNGEPGLFVDAVLTQGGEQVGVTSPNTTTNTSTESVLESTFVGTNLLNSSLSADIVNPPLLFQQPIEQFEPFDPLSPLSLEEKEEVRKIAGEGLLEKTPSAKTSQLQITSIRSNPIRPGDAGVCTP